MRISDWSSDVCSSDLRCVRRGLARLSIVIAVVLPGDCVARDQPLMELDVAVVADGDDAAGALAVVLTERDVLLDDLLQLIAPGGEPIRFGFELFGPIVRFDAHQLVLALVEALQDRKGTRLNSSH